MSEDDELIAVWTGTFRLFGGDVKCSVLSGGQRVIEADSMAELFERMGSGDHTALDPDELAAFACWRLYGYVPPPEKATADGAGRDVV